ncbi:MAG: hypothetical protein QXU32_01875 [Nitrososphaerales archaeon]
MANFNKMLSEALEHSIHNADIHNDAEQDISHKIEQPTPDKSKDDHENERRQRAIDRLVYKINRCIDYQSLYALEDDFNQVGLTIQSTPNNRMILCRIVDGKPYAQRAIDDYIFIGGLDSALNELTDRAAMKICDFVRTNASNADKIRNVARVWRNGLKMYESTISIVNEAIEAKRANAIIESAYRKMGLIGRIDAALRNDL